MKSKFLALTMCLAALSTAPVCAEATAGSNMISKNHVPGHNSFDFLRATGINPRSFVSAIVGAPVAPFTPISFSLHELGNGEAIDLKKNDFRFELQPGSYEVSFTGTFEGLGTLQAPLSIIDLSLRVDDDFKSLGSQTVVATELTIMSATTIITVEKETKISMDARNRGLPGADAQVLKRVISIVKLK
ncbi:MAG TPA: hypothetical protein VN457_06035 [Chlamydiales bacterium]|nr:hypothetical protein [Chlamydiales bacterium]